MACPGLSNGLLLLRLPSKNLVYSSIDKPGNLTLRSCGARVSKSIRASAFSVPLLNPPMISGRRSTSIPREHLRRVAGELLAAPLRRSPAYLETQIISDKIKPTALLGEVMSTRIRAATADQTLEEIDHHFEFVSGLPVVDGELRCIGVVSKKDKAKASNGLKSKVGEFMSTPAITLSPDKMVLGMVTRTDIFQAL